jgi:hypothetical protein
MRPLAWLAALWLAAGTALAQAPGAVEPEGPPRPGGELVDREFGVGTDQFGLDRRVEMYQWLRVGEDRYQREWKAALVDSSDFAPGHENPRSMPLEGRRWWAEGATLDGRPLDTRVLKVVGRWEDFRPSFSRLPGNLLATFQPEGDGLISSENPLDPQIGDLRVSWRELVLPPLAGKVELVDGAWQVATPAAAPGPASAERGVPPAPAAPAPAEAGPRWWPWLLGVAALVALGAWIRRRPGR